MMLRRRTVLSGVPGMLFAAPAGAREMLVHDHAGRAVVVRDASRVLAIGGDVTETVFSLDAGDRLVGTDSTSLYPEAVARVPKVGYMRQLAAEGILSLQPSLVIATTAAGPAATFTQLRDAGVATLVLAEDYDFPGVVRKIETIGAALDRTALARQMVHRKTGEMDAVSAALSAAAGGAAPPRVLFLLSMGQGSPQAAGGRTAADGIIRLAQARNAIDSYQGYRPVSAEGVVAAAPDVILVTNESLAALGGVERLLDNAALRLTPAARHRRVLALDALLMLGFGPRTPEAVRRLGAFLYPDAGLGPPG